MQRFISQLPAAAQALKAGAQASGGRVDPTTRGHFVGRLAAAMNGEQIECAWRTAGATVLGYHARMMLNPPSRTDMRRYFCEVYAKWRNGEPLDAMEALLSAWMREHPEFNAVLSQPNAPVGSVPHPDHADNANPFLHLSMHLALSEQSSIDRPRGIRQALELLAARYGSLHEAHHAAMECLSDMIERSQSTGLPLDGDSYLACVQRKATKR